MGCYCRLRTHRASQAPPEGGSREERRLQDSLVVKEAGSQPGKGAQGPRISISPVQLSQPQVQHPTKEPLVLLPSPLPHSCLAPAQQLGAASFGSHRLLGFVAPLQWLTPGPTCFFLVFHTFLPKVCAPLAQSFKNTVQLLVGNSFLPLLLYLPYPLPSPASGWFPPCFISFLFIYFSLSKKKNL